MAAVYGSPTTAAVPISAVWWSTPRPLTGLGPPGDADAVPDPLGHDQGEGEAQPTKADDRTTGKKTVSAVSPISPKSPRSPDTPG